MQVGQHVDHLAGRLDLVAAVSGESIDEARGADAAEPRRGDLGRPAPTVGTELAFAYGRGPRDEDGIRDRAIALIGWKRGFTRLAEQVTATLTGPAQGHSLPIRLAADGADRSAEMTSQLDSAELAVTTQLAELPRCPRGIHTRYCRNRSGGR